MKIELMKRRFRKVKVQNQVHGIDFDWHLCICSIYTGSGVAFIDLAVQLHRKCPKDCRLHAPSTAFTSE